MIGAVLGALGGVMAVVALVRTLRERKRAIGAYRAAYAAYRDANGQYEAARRLYTQTTSMVESRGYQRPLVTVLRELVEHDTDYVIRYGLVIEAMRLALLSGWEVGVDIDEKNHWPVVFIELPTGQVSWHMPPHYAPWDGHTTEEKFERINAYIGGGR